MIQHLNIFYFHFYFPFNGRSAANEAGNHSNWNEQFQVKVGMLAKVTAVRTGGN